MNNKKKVRNKFIKIFLYFNIIILSIILLFYFINDNTNNLMLYSAKNMINNISKYTNIRFRNKERKCEIDKKILNENKNLEKEIDKLKKVLDLNQTLSDKTLINSTVINRNISYWYNKITIDKGKKQKVKKGYAVVNESGLIGKVIKVYKNSSEVKLLSSKNIDYISSMFIYGDKEYYGLIDKYDIKTNEFRMKNVIGDFSNMDEIYVTTSGLSDNFRRGLTIGKIKRIEKDKYGISNYIYITPLSNFDDISIVTVVGE